MFHTHYVRGLSSAATAATADHGIAALWNPHASRRIILVEVAVFCLTAPAANSGFKLNRITTKGTPNSDVTPDADNSSQADSTSPAGALLSQGTYSVQPTLATPPLYGWAAPAVAGAGIILPFPNGIEIPAGTGILINNRAAVAFPQSEITFVFGD